MGGIELTPEENFTLLRKIDANRAFMLLAYRSNPDLLRLADPEIRRLFDSAPGANTVTQDRAAG